MPTQFFVRRKRYSLTHTNADSSSNATSMQGVSIPIRQMHRTLYEPTLHPSHINSVGTNDAEFSHALLKLFRFACISERSTGQTEGNNNNILLAG